MNLADDCLLIPVADPAAAGTADLRAIGTEQSLSSVMVLRALDHEHRAGEGLESSLAIVAGPKAAERADAIEAALDAAGLGVVTGETRRLDLRGAFDSSKTDGDHMVAVCVDFSPTADDARAQEDEFDRWYTYEHMGDVTRAGGIHRAFRGAADDGRPRRYWCWYETDDPAVFMESRQGKAAWGGLWLDNIDQSTFRRSYFAIDARWVKE